MLMITESNFDVKTSIDENKRMYIEGIFATANKTNKNGRVYEKALWEREIDKILPSVAEHSLVGELNHPIDRSEIDFNEAALKIVDLRWDGDNIMGRAMVLSTPKGKLVQSLIDDKVRIGISSRGLGTVTEGKVNQDFELKTWDIVHNPSNHGSWVNGILEGFEVKPDTDEKDKQEQLNKIVEQEKEQLAELQTAYTSRVMDILNTI